MDAATPGRRRFADELTQTLDALLFASPSHRTRERVADGLAQLDRAQQDVVLHWAHVVAQNNPELAWQVCARAPKAFAGVEGLTGVTDAQFAAWVQALLAQRDGHHPGSKIDRDWLDDIGGFLRWSADASRLPLTQISRRLGLFLRGLGSLGGEGNPDSWLSLQPLADKDLRAWTDSAALYLPKQLDGLATRSETFRAYQRLALLLWAQVQQGSLDPRHGEALAAMADPVRAQHWYELLEQERLRAQLCREYPGLAQDWPVTEGVPTELRAAVQAQGFTVSDTVTLVRQLVAQTLSSPPQASLRIDFAAVRAYQTSALGDPARALRRLSNVFRGHSQQAKSTDKSGQALDMGMPDTADNGDAGTLAGPSDDAPVATKHSEAPPPPEGNLMPAGPAENGRWRASTQASAPDELVEQIEAPPAASALYDEWDYRRNAYRRDWCHVFERVGAAGDVAWVEAVVQRHARAIRQIRRRFESLRGEDVWQRRQMEGTDIDLDAWVDAVGDARAGNEIDARLFCQRQRQERSLAALFMVDMSGSTKGWVNEAEREALVMLCEAIEALGDRYAIYGFSGWTHQRCDIYRIKGFDERYASPVKARIAGIEACDYTRMGPAIRHLSKLLSAQPERHKLLVSISDGRPDDFGDEYRGRYGIEDTRRALHEVRVAGIRSYCVTVDRHAADYLPQLYGSAHYSVLADAKTLPLRIAQVYRRLVA